MPLSIKSMLTVLAVAAFIAGCGSTDNGDTVAHLRVLNAYVPATGASAVVNVTVNGASLTGTSGVGFGQFAFSGLYSSVAAGPIAPQATGTGLSSPLQFATAPTVNAKASYVLVIAGKAGDSGATVPQLYLVSDFTANQLAIPSGSLAIRVINFSFNPVPIGLYSTNAGVPTTPLNSAFSSIPFATAAANGYAIVPASQISNLAVVDSTNPGAALAISPTSTLNTLPAFFFGTGKAFTLYVVGQPGNVDEPLGAFWARDFPVQ